MRVYCAACRFVLPAPRVPSARRAPSRCLHPHARMLIEAPEARVLHWRTTRERNAQNDCRDYRPLRWWERALRVDPAVLAVVLLLHGALFLVYAVWQGR